MDFPPSLPAAIRESAFKARNGELAFRFEDVSAILEACRRDGVAVLGWDAWLIDHASNFGPPAPSSGSWTGLLPTVNGDLVSASASVKAVRGEQWLDFVSRSASETLESITRTNLDDVVAEWRPLLRMNLTFASRLEFGDLPSGGAPLNASSPLLVGANKTIALWAAILVAHAALTALIARVTHIPYDYFSISELALYCAAGFFIFKTSQSMRTSIVGTAFVGLMDATIGWAASTAIGPGRIAYDNSLFDGFAVFFVTLTATLFGWIGSLLSKAK